MMKEERAVLRAALKWRAAEKAYRENYKDSNYKAIIEAVRKLEKACDALAAKTKAKAGRLRSTNSKHSELITDH